MVVDISILLSYSFTFSSSKSFCAGLNPGAASSAETTSSAPRRSGARPDSALRQLIVRARDIDGRPASTARNSRIAPLAIAQIQIQLAEFLVRVFILQIDQIQALERRGRVLLLPLLDFERRELLQQSTGSRPPIFAVALQLRNRLRLCRPWPGTRRPEIRTRCPLRRSRSTTSRIAVPSLITSSQFFALAFAATCLSKLLAPFVETVDGCLGLRIVQPGEELPVELFGLHA